VVAIARGCHRLVAQYHADPTGELCRQLPLLIYGSGNADGAARNLHAALPAHRGVLFHRQSTPKWDRQWYEGAVGLYGTLCPTGRRPDGMQCDEQPSFTMAEGGVPSSDGLTARPGARLELIAGHENRVAGNALGGLYKFCPSLISEPPYDHLAPYLPQSAFLNIPLPGVDVPALWFCPRTPTPR
jgi:hypothetical protein